MSTRVLGLKFHWSAESRQSAIGWVLMDRPDSEPAGSQRGVDIGAPAIELAIARALHELADDPDLHVELHAYRDQRSFERSHSWRDGLAIEDHNAATREHLARFIREGIPAMIVWIGSEPK